MSGRQNFQASAYGFRIKIDMVALIDQVKMILLTGALVSTLAVIGIYTLPEITYRQVKSKPVLLNTSPDRTPNAINKEEFPHTEIPVLVLSCDHFLKTTFVSPAPQIRFRGVHCYTGEINENELSTSITNITTGYSATILNLTALKYTTDFVSLGLGDNRILVRQKTVSGALRDQELVVAYLENSDETATTK